MTITKEIEGKIIRYFHVDKWLVGTIAKQVDVHHSTVERVLRENGAPHPKPMKKTTMIVPYLPFILEKLEQYPKLTASRLYTMVKERGYPGAPDHFRSLIAKHRPKKAYEAFLRLSTLPGEQGQVDWGHFGKIQIGRALRPLSAFVIVLSYSRKIFLKFFLNQQMPSFLRGHEAAFEAWGGLPRVLLYDNLKSAVLERSGNAVRFNPTLIDFANHYRFEPRPVAVARGNEKGRVERSIRYIRDNFFEGRTWEDLDELNAQAQAWCDGIASERRCPEDRDRSVQEVFEEEQAKLMKLPDNPYPAIERQEVKVGKTPYVRFDLNDYSIPHKHVRSTLTVIATQETITIQDGSEVLGTHQRSYDKGVQIEEEAHIAALTAQKHHAREGRGKNRLINAIPSAAKFLEKTAEHGYNLGSSVSTLLQYLDRYGAAEVTISIEEALIREVPHVNAVRLSLERRREAKCTPPPLPVALPKDPRVQDLVIKPHALKSYDVITDKESDNE